jgi:diadenosine tetraphosphate (Ap4A) HIT family hydrolase
MRKCYKRIEHKRILLSSLRGDTPHFHIHILPLWPEEYKSWKRVTGYPGSHLMEFLGSLEKKHDFLLLQREAKEDKSEETQCLESTKALSAEIRSLRQIIGYKSSTPS